MVLNIKIDTEVFKEFLEAAEDNKLLYFIPFGLWLLFKLFRKIKYWRLIKKYFKVINLLK